jgi:hypothetical protein
MALFAALFTAPVAAPFGGGIPAVVAIGGRVAAAATLGGLGGLGLAIAGIGRRRLVLAPILAPILAPAGAEAPAPRAFLVPIPVAVATPVGLAGPAGPRGGDTVGLGGPPAAQVRKPLEVFVLAEPAAALVPLLVELARGLATRRLGWLGRRTARGALAAVVRPGRGARRRHYLSDRGTARSGRPLPRRARFAPAVVLPAGVLPWLGTITVLGPGFVVV